MLLPVRARGPHGTRLSRHDLPQLPAARAQGVEVRRGATQRRRPLRPLQDARARRAGQWRARASRTITIVVRPSPVVRRVSISDAASVEILARDVRRGSGSITIAFDCASIVIRFSVSRAIVIVYRSWFYVIVAGYANLPHLF